MPYTKRYLLSAWTLVPLGLLLAGVMIWRFGPAPVPATLRIAGGPSGGVYAMVAEQYTAHFSGHGLRASILQTAGSVENLALLRDGAVDIALVQGGLAGSALPPDQRDRDADLVSLGSVFFEPVWIFVRADLPRSSKRDLEGLRIAAGPEGSGTRALATALLRANDLSEAALTLLPLTGMAAAEALLAGEVDIVFLVAGKVTAPIDRLMRAPDRAILFDATPRAEAYARLLPYLTPVRLPRGGISLAEDLPSDGVTLLAPAAYVAARADINPQLAALIAGVMREVHADRQGFAAEGRFPSLLNQDLPMQPDARRFLERGPPLLQSTLPFHFAVLLDRLSVLLLPLVGVVLPLLRFAPQIYRWRIERRIWMRYGDLLRIESGMLGRDGPKREAERAALSGRLVELERRVAALNVPAAHGRHLFALRRDIAYLRQRLESGGPPA